VHDDANLNPEPHRHLHHPPFTLHINHSPFTTHHPPFTTRAGHPSYPLPRSSLSHRTFRLLWTVQAQRHSCAPVP
jgi:hypothetical protein